ncbi:MAG: sigma-70 family RNA polymerase sigma factor [Planctomycetes bacterium]|nr:sigma-70 family RNA polymerase sigma factor [Planctomycetota bacterium]
MSVAIGFAETPTRFEGAVGAGCHCNLTVERYTSLMKGHPDSDMDLVRVCQANGRQEDQARCLETLLRRYNERIAGWCLDLLRDREDAADCTQEILIRISRGIRGFQGQCSFASWVYALSRKACASVLQRRRRLDSQAVALPPDAFEIPSKEREPFASVTDDEATRLLHDLIRESITQTELEVLVLHHLEGQSMHVVTERLGLTNRSGARAFLTSAKRKLRRHLSAERLREVGFHIPFGEHSDDPPAGRSG